MDNIGWYIIDVVALLLFAVPAWWFGKEAKRSGDLVQHRAAISFGVVAALVLARIVETPVL